MSAIVEPNLTRYLSPQAKNELDHEMRNISDEMVNRLVQSIISEPFMDQTVWNPERHYEIQLIGYKALLSGVITLNQFVTISLVASAFEQFQQRVFEIQWSKDIPQKVKSGPTVFPSKFEVTTTEDDEWEEILFDMVEKLDDSLIEDEEIAIREMLKESLENLPASEKLFFSYIIPTNRILNISPMLAVLQHQEIPFINIELLKRGTDQIKITFCSYTIYKNLLEIINPDGMKPEPVFGNLNTIMMRRFFYEGVTPVNIPLPMESLIQNGELTQKADGHIAGPFGFIVHDLFYHGWLKAKVSLDQAEIFQAIVRALIEVRKNYDKNSPEYKDLSHDVWMIVDMDFNTLNIRESPFLIALEFLTATSKHIVANMESEAVQQVVSDLDSIFSDYKKIA